MAFGVAKNLIARVSILAKFYGPSRGRFQKTILALVALLTANVIADLGLAQLIAAGRVRGDWELALAFSMVPAIGIIYALALLLMARGTAE